MRYLILTLCVTAIAFLGVAIDHQSQSEPERMEPLPITQQEWIYAAGRIEGLTEEIELRPQIHGRVTQVHVSMGDVVEAGTVLMSLDDSQYRHALSLAQAELATARARLASLKAGARSEELREARALHAAKVAELDRARVSLERIERLRRSDAATVQQADDERAQVKTLQAQVDAAQARIDLLEAGTRKEDIRIAETEVAAMEARVSLAQVQLERTRLKAPCSGKILRLSIEQGELAGPDSPTPPVVMADTTGYRVRAYVEELDAPRVTVGMSAVATVDGLPGKEFAGRVTRISPRMGTKKIFRDSPGELFDVKTREIWIELEPTGEELVVGLRVDVRLKNEK